jgi:hypothetical protein
MLSAGRHARGNAHEFTSDEAREAGSRRHENDGKQGGNQSGNQGGGNQGGGNQGSKDGGR